MAERTLKVTIAGDASKATRELQKFGKQTSVLSKTAGAAFKGVKLAAKGIAVGLGVAAAGLVGATKKFGDFDAALTESVAIMGDVSDQMRGDMSAAAREVGKNTKFSAEQAAESFFFLASAGLDAKSSIEALPAVAAFAQAGNFDMALATDLATDAQSALGLASEDSAENLENLTRVSDVFVKANTLANASVEQFATSMTSKAGAALRTVGKDIEEGTAVLAVFADQGIKGERAGTILRAMLDGLSKNARDNTAAFEELGVSVFDSEGNMRNMADIAADLEGAMDGMTVEQKQATLSQLGFNKRSKEGILALLGNSEALREYEGELRNAGGTTDEVAENQMDSLNAQMGLLKDRLIDAGLTIGKELEPRVRELVEGFSDWITENGEIVDSIADMAARGFDKIIEFAEWFGNNFGQRIEDGASPLQAFLGTVKDVAEKIVGMIPAKVTGQFSEFGSGLTLMLGPLALIARELFPLLKPLLAATLPILAEMANKAAPALAEALQFIAREILPGFIEMVEAVIGWLGDNKGFVAAIVAAGVAFKVFTAIMATNPFVLIATAVIAIAALIITNWDTIVAFLKKTWDWITTNVARVGKWFKDKFNEAIEFVKNIFLNFTGPGLLIKHWDDIKEGVGDVVGFFQDKWDEAIGFFTGLPGRIGTAASGMWDGIKNAFRGAINWIISRWNSFQIRLGGQRVDLPFGQGFDIPSIVIDTPNIPRLHQGGVFHAPPGQSEGLALLEEGERIISARGGDGPLIGQVIVQGQVDAMSVADLLSWKMRTAGV